MATFSLILQKPYIKNKSGEKKLNPEETRLYLFVIHDRQNVAKIKTEFTVISKEWDFKKQCIKHQIPGSVPVNNKLDELKKAVREQYNQIRDDFPEMKFNEITENLKEFVKTDISPVYNEKNKTFFQIFDEYLEAKGNDVSPLTIKKYNTLKKSLKEFMPSITFDKIDLNFYDKYVVYLRSKQPTGRQKSRNENEQIGLLNDTTAKYIENLKNFIKWSYEHDKTTNRIFEHSGFKAERKQKNDIVTINKDELKQLYEYDLSNNKRLEKTRDVFCFGCFTGQRWSDIERFNKNSIIGNTWTFESYKTKQSITVPFVGYCSPALDIIKKYDYQLPIISPQKFNEYLKEVGELVGLERPVKIKRYIGKREIVISEPLFKFLSSHTARRTAVSILLNVEEMPIHKVRQITGHTSLKTLDKYIDKDSKALEESLSKTRDISSTVMKIIKKEVV